MCSFTWGSIYSSLEGLAIVEIKQEQASQDSEFVQVMKNLRVRPTSLSKYCAGVYLLYDAVKSNNFKTKMRRINKLMQEVNYDIR